MSSWGNKDAAANAPYWAASSVHLQPDAANTELLFDNTTPDDFIVGETVGLFGVSAQEAQVNQKGAHTGWVLRTVGSGGRANRVQEEVLVAMNTMTSDSDGQTYANVSISLSTLGSKSVVYGGGNTAVFTVTPTLTGNTSATLTYQWQTNHSGTWGNVSNGTPANTTYSGGTTASLTITPTYTNANGYKYRVIVTAADQGVTSTSANGTLTVS